MKKLLSFLLVMAVAFSLLAGCTQSPTKTPENTTNPTNPTPTPNVDIPVREPVFDDIIEFNVFNTQDYQARWTEASRELMLSDYKLKIAYEIPAIKGYEVVWGVATGRLMDSEANRLAYNQSLALLFSTPDKPDYLPSVFASNVGANAPWIDLSSYLVDINTYLKPGELLYEPYLNFVWDGAQDYWNTFKSFLETDDGELFVLPRREMRPINSYAAWNRQALNSINIAWDDKATDWDTFVEQLTSYKKVSNAVAPFQSYLGKPEDIIKFVASTYGLDFNADFSWTTRNGGAHWTYCWPEYLEILQKVNDLAADGLVYTSKKTAGCISGYKFDTSFERPLSESAWTKQAATTGLFMFTRQDKIAEVGSSGWKDAEKGPTWTVSDTWIEEEGYQYSLFGGSSFDIDYLAIGNRINKERGDDEFSLRICKWWVSSMNLDGMCTYLWGKEGVPFADTVEEAGSYKWIDFDGEQKVIWTGNAHRYAWKKELASPDYDAWFWADKENGWFEENLDPHYAQYIDYKINAGKSYTTPGYGESNADIIGITDTGCFDNMENWMTGTYFFADVTAYPMKYTIYWRNESQCEHLPLMEALEADCKSHNGVIYTGFFASTNAICGNGAAQMNDKIFMLKNIAKNYTTDFLGHVKGASDWTSYIKNLKDAGYDEVFEYYQDALFGCPTDCIDSIKSQKDILVF